MLSKFDAYLDEKRTTVLESRHVKSAATQSRRPPLTGAKKQNNSDIISVYSGVSEGVSISTSVLEDESEIGQELTEIKTQIDDIDRTLQKNGGINVGWEATDHQDFLRLRQRYKGKVNTVAFMNDIMGCVPERDEEQVKLHAKMVDE
jgi:hypothetical protein